MHGSRCNSLFETIADPEFLNFRHQAGDECIKDTIEHVKTFHRDARLAAIEKTADGCRTHGFVDIRVITDDHRIASTEFERDAFHVCRRCFHDVLTGLRRPGEGNLSNARILKQ